MPTIRWPRCEVHDIKLVLYREVALGSPWACPECGAVSDTEPEN